MASPGNGSGRNVNAKVYQGIKNGQGNTSGQSAKQGQTAALRPAGLTLSQNVAGSSPTRQAMDYKSAVSPARGTASNSGPSQVGLNAHFTVGGGGYGYRTDNLTLADNEAFEPFDGDYYLGQTQAVNNQRREWANPPRMPQFDTAVMEEDPVAGLHGADNLNQHKGNPVTDPQEYDAGDQDGTESSEQLPHIPEGEELEDEGLEKDEEQREMGYIERHSAWINVLDENLQKIRRNLAERDASEEFDMDMGELLSAVEDIIEITGSEGEVATETLFLNSRLFAEGIRNLQNHSLVIHTVDLRVVVDSGNARAHIFANSPLKMGNKTVFPLPWDTRFSTKDLKSRTVPVWLELSNVHPGLMTFGLNMLRKIGPIIYAAKNVETKRVNIIRGGVLMDLSQPLPEFIPIAVPEAPDRVMRQKIRYLRLPDACFTGKGATLQECAP
ncbi:hypothetical protein R1sor_005668 [Riccia sorocarpa]|uniref:DUF4283 domain-containing protein n=1 Tax=Riccia sorocarpa TaxID=122646 RepID=A0ABD3HN73_9MARC